MGTNKKQIGVKKGRYCGIYIPEELLETWDSIEEKSKFIQEALRTLQVNNL